MSRLFGYLSCVAMVWVAAGCSPAEPAHTLEDNKALARVYERVVSERNVSLLDDVLGANYRYHGPGIELDVAGIKGHVDTFLQMFPDLRLTVDFQVAEGDYVATRFRAIGTNTGGVEGMPATGRKATVNGIYILRIVDGKIVEEWEDYDEAGMLRQLGVLPAS